MLSSSDRWGHSFGEGKGVALGYTPGLLVTDASESSSIFCPCQGQG